MKILLGTKNQHKVKELQKIAKEYPNFEFISLNELKFVEEPIEDGTSFYENALIKARYYYEMYHIPVITDDSGIVVNALNGKPGIYSARYASTNGKDASSIQNRQKLLNDLKEITNRKAYFECDMVFYDGTTTINTSGVFEGEILNEEIGENGFGYDPIFFASCLGKPLGLVSEEIKNQYSHRFLAFSKLLSLLNEKFK